MQRSENDGPCLEAGLLESYWGLRRVSTAGTDLFKHTIMSEMVSLLKCKMCSSRVLWFAV